MWFGGLCGLGGFSGIGDISDISSISDISDIIAEAFVQFLVSVGLQVLNCFFVAHCFLGSATVFAAGS